MANQAWSHFVSLNDAYNSVDGQWKASLNTLSQSARLFQVADALIRDTLMACFRLLDLDDSGITLLRIHEILSIQAVRTNRLSFFAQCQFTSQDQAIERIDLFMSYFPTEWSSDAKQKRWPKQNECPKDWTLADLRAELVPVRHRLIAHAGTFSRNVPIEKIDKLVKLTDELVCLAEWLFKGCSASTLTARQTETVAFWGAIQNGFINSACPSKS